MKKFAGLFILLAGIFWGTAGIFLRLLQNEGLSSVQAATVRITVAAIIFNIFMLIYRPSLFKIKLRDIWLFAVTGIISISGMCVLYLYTINHSTLATAVILLYMSPVVVMILSAVFLKDKITPKGMIALIIASMGCILVAGIGSGFTISFVTLLTGLGSAVAFGSYSIFGTMALKKYHPLTVTAISFIFGSVVLLLISQPHQICTIFYNSEHKVRLLIEMLSIGIVTGVLPFGLYTLGLENTPPSKAAIIACSEPMAATIFGMIIYGEFPDAAGWIGIVLILSAIVLLNVNIHIPFLGSEKQ